MKYLFEQDTYTAQNMAMDTNAWVVRTYGQGNSRTEIESELIDRHQEKKQKQIPWPELLVNQKRTG